MIRVPYRQHQTNYAENQQLSYSSMRMDNGNGFIQGQTCLEDLKQRKINIPVWCLPKTL